MMVGCELLKSQFVSWFVFVLGLGTRYKGSESLQGFKHAIWEYRRRFAVDVS